MDELFGKRRFGGDQEAPIEEQISDALTLEQRRRKHRLDGIKIVIVEDTADARYLIGRYLSSAGAVTYPAASADEARELLKQVDPDVIISDIGMPEEDGISFIRTLRDSEKNNGKHIPAIALTAYVGLEHRNLTLRAGFEEHLCKPVGAGALIDTILKVVHNSGPSFH